MDIANLKRKVTHNQKIKTFVHWCLMSRLRCAPRLWVKIFVNPFFLKRGRGSLVKWSAILNVSPINKFTIGSNSVIENFSLIDNAVGDVTIGANSRVGLRNTVIGPVKIGNNVIIAQNVVISGLNHNYQDPNIPIHKQGVNKKPIVINDDVWVGANSTITSGVVIGHHCVIAGGSVVVCNIPPYSVCAGVPARIIKAYDFERKEWSAPIKK